MKRPKLAKLELRIPEALWAHGKASMREIQEAFPEPRPAYTTITNTVYRMEAKHAVRRVRKVGKRGYSRATDRQGRRAGYACRRNFLQPDL